MCIRPALLSSLLLFSVGAAADAILPMPASPLYVKECGGCHTAYAPTYLPAASWRKLMTELERHFGDDASLTTEERDVIASQLQALAMDTPQGHPEIAARNGRQWAGSLPTRITTSPYFHFKHDEVPSSIWRRPQIASKSNCVACHPRADIGRYPEAEIRIPK